MGQFIDLTGQVFGKLAVLSRAENKNGKPAWNCHCTCGNTKIIEARNLRCAGVVSCGCKPVIDLDGQTFGRLTVISRNAHNKRGVAQWDCECACGNRVTATGVLLRRGSIRSCGCFQREQAAQHCRELVVHQHPRSVLDLAGQQFGRLTVLAKAVGRYKEARWECLCSCGTVKTILASSLRSGATTSCGCFGKERAREKNTTHGLSAHVLYGTWTGMMWRCYHPEHEAYQDYGGRGIAVCERWHSVAAFIFDIEALIGPRPEGYTLDRINNDGSYEPGNVRWATPEMQEANKRWRSVA